MLVLKSHPLSSAPNSLRTIGMTSLEDAGAFSDGIIDRIFYDSYVVNILPVDKDDDKSMREVYGMTYAV